MAQKRILHIIHGLNLGGAETFIYNLLSGINSEKFRFDFAIQNPVIRHTKFKQLIEERGGVIHIIPDFRKAPFQQVRVLSRILNTGYDCVHIHMNAIVNPLPAIVASRFNNKVIIHSHNTKNGSGGIVAKIAHLINKRLFINSKSIRLACGTDAGRWMFGKHTFQIINNAVNLNKYRFSEVTRAKIRNCYNIKPAEFVIGHIGRFAEVKNQKFLLKCLYDFKSTYPDIAVRLMLIGEGELLEATKQYAKTLGLSDNVVFTGGVNNPEEYYMAFDCFALPSLFEGLAFVAVEAQASGLRVIASNNNTKEIDLTGHVEFLPLEGSEKQWVEKIHYCCRPTDRDAISQKLQSSNYDMKVLIDKMSEIYGD